MAPLNTTCPTPDRICKTPVTYKVSYPEPANHTFHVTIIIGPVPESILHVAMPVWIPGSYHIADFSTNVHSVRCTGAALERLSKNRWRLSNVSRKGCKFSYKVFALGSRVGESHLDEEHALINPPSVLMCVDELRRCPIAVVFDKPGAHKIYTPLLMKGNVLRGGDYDELADSPIEIGTPLVLRTSFKSRLPAPRTSRQAGGRNKVIRFVIHGECSFNRRTLLSDVRRFAAAIGAVFRDVPFDVYTFFLHFSSMHGGGLEHKYASCIVVRNNCFAPRKSYLKLLKLLAHEYFHLYNVKRLKPAEFTWYDYYTENYTTLLWFFEGVTDYMAHKILLDCGIATPVEYCEWMSELVTAYFNTPGRRVQSLSDSSFETWIKLYKPNQNSVNSGISYYLKGLMIGLLMDLSIRRGSRNRKSIKDLFHRLYWATYKNGSCVTYEDIASIYAELGGRRADLAAWVDTTAELPLSRVMSVCGLMLKRQAVKNTFELRVNFKSSATALVVASVPADSPLSGIGLREGDEIIALNRKKVTPANLNDALASINTPSMLEVTVFRDEVIRSYKARVSDLKKYEYAIRSRKALRRGQKQAQISYLGRLLSGVR